MPSAGFGITRAFPQGTLLTGFWFLTALWSGSQRPLVCISHHTTFIWHLSCLAEPCLHPDSAIWSSLLLLAIGLRHELCVFIQVGCARGTGRAVQWAQAVPELSAKARPHTPSSPHPRLPPRAESCTGAINLIIYLDISLGSSHTHWSGVCGIPCHPFASVFSVMTWGLRAAAGSTTGQLHATVQPGLLAPSLGGT